MDATILSTDDALLAARPPIDQATATVDFSGLVRGHFLPDAFDGHPAASEHLATVDGVVYEDHQTIELDLITPGALETRFRSQPLKRNNDGLHRLDAVAVTVEYEDGDGKVVAVPFQARIFFPHDRGGEIQRVGWIVFEAMPTPAPRSAGHPIRFRMDMARLGEKAVMDHVARLRKADILESTSFQIDNAVGGVDRAAVRDAFPANDAAALWSGVEDAHVEPIAGTVQYHRLEIEIAGVLVCTHRDGRVSRHDVEVDLTRDNSSPRPLRYRNIGLRYPNAVPASEKPKPRAPLDIADAEIRLPLEDFLDGIETLTTVEIAQHATSAVIRLLGPWVNLEWAIIAVDAGTLSNDADLLAVTGTLRFKQRGRAAESRAVLISVAEPADDHACPEIDLLP